MTEIVAVPDFEKEQDRQLDDRSHIQDYVRQRTVVATRRTRKAWDASTMGFGKHVYEYIDPDEIPTDFKAPEGLLGRRDFETAYNVPNSETDMNLDLGSRKGCKFTTNAKGYEGEWFVVAQPALTQINGHSSPTIRVSREEEGPIEQEIPAVSLGFVAERVSNLYENEVITKWLSGGKANKASRRELTVKGCSPS